MSFETKDSGKREEFSGGMKRDTQEGKTLWHLTFDGPLFQRWAELLTRGAEKYDEGNWMKAEGDAELQRFRASAFRHFMQWFRGDGDEDHAAAVVFNLNGAEYVKGNLAWLGDEVNDEHQHARDTQQRFHAAGECHICLGQPQNQEVETFHGIPIDEPVDLDKMFPSNDYEGDAPDAYCYTQADGQCISDDPRCMHNLPSALEYTGTMTTGYTIPAFKERRDCCGTEYRNLHKAGCNIGKFLNKCEPVVTGVDLASPKGDRSFIRVVALDPKLQGAADALTTVLNANLCQPEKKVEYATLLRDKRAQLIDDAYKSMEADVWGPYASRTEAQDWEYPKPSLWARVKLFWQNVKAKLAVCFGDEGC